MHSYFFARKIKVLRGKIVHVFFKFRKVVVGERPRYFEIIIKSVFNCGPNAELGLGELFQDRHCQQMRQRMADVINILFWRGFGHIDLIVGDTED